MSRLGTPPIDPVRHDVGREHATPARAARGGRAGSGPTIIRGRRGRIGARHTRDRGGGSGVRWFRVRAHGVGPHSAGSICARGSPFGGAADASPSPSVGAPDGTRAAHPAGTADARSRTWPAGPHTSGARGARGCAAVSACRRRGVAAPARPRRGAAAPARARRRAVSARRDATATGPRAIATGLRATATELRATATGLRLGTARPAHPREPGWPAAR